MTAEEKRLRRELQQLQTEVRNLRAVLGTQVNRIGQIEGLRGQRVFLARHDGEGGDWQEIVPTGDGTTLGDFVGGRHSTTNDIVVDPAAAADEENVCAVLQTRTAGGRLVFVRIGGSASIDLYNDTTLVLADAPLIGISPTRATKDILEFAGVTISGTNGAELRFKSGPSARQVLQWGSGGTVIWDYMRTY